MNRTLRRSLSAVLLLAVCFVAIAIFSPLHKHENGRCSLNNVERYQTESPADYAVVSVHCGETSPETVAAVDQTAVSADCDSRSPARAPPASSLHPHVA